MSFRKYFQSSLFNPLKSIYFYFADIAIKNKLFAIEKSYLSHIPSKNIISFCLYGDGKRYINNIDQCISSYKEFFPDWKIRIYLSQDIPSKIFNQIKELDCEVVVMKLCGKDFRYTYWRFLPLDDDELNILLVRDIDSLASKREQDMVYNWMKSGKKLHIIRDHVLHNAKIMGGMWGMRTNGHVYGIVKEMQKFNKKNRYGSDQMFLERIYTSHATDMYVNDVVKRYPNENPFIMENEFSNFYIGKINLEEQL